eukprot:gene12093-2693_t
MSQNKNILSYFTTVTRKKRGNDEEKEISEESNKRPRTNENNDKQSGPQRSSLSPEQKKTIEQNRHTALLRLQNNTSGMLSQMGESWRIALNEEFSKEYFQKLKKFVDSERKTKTIYPPGLCFSVKIGVPPPPSLVNIFKELKQDIDGFEIPDHGYLAGWAQQGVLLLNAVLTVVAHNANSHQGKGWERFTDAVIKKINSNLNGVVFLLWGAYAQKKGASIDKKRHCVLKGPHPSPLSAHRGFFGCKHFSQANEYLSKNGKKEIDWRYLPKDI